TQYVLLPPSSFLFRNAPPPPYPSPLSLHDALPISASPSASSTRSSAAPPRPGSSERFARNAASRTRSVPTQSSTRIAARSRCTRSEEHTSELQSPYDLVCRLLLEKKNKEKTHITLR